MVEAPLFWTSPCHLVYPFLCTKKREPGEMGYTVGAAVHCLDYRSRMPFKSLSGATPDWWGKGEHPGVVPEPEALVLLCQAEVTVITVGQTVSWLPRSLELPTTERGDCGFDFVSHLETHLTRCLCSLKAMRLLEPSSITGTQMMEGRNQLPQTLLSAFTQIHTHTKMRKQKFQQPRRHHKFQRIFTVITQLPISN